MANAFEIAAGQLGMNERDQQTALQEYMANGGVNLDPSVTAWCAAFVNATLQQSGGQGTGSNAARSFMEWGQEASDPRRGDLAVFSRGDPNGWQGHVGFFDGYNEDGTIRVLGGNQGDSVSIANYSADQLLGFRRGETPPNTPAQPQTAPQNAMSGFQQQQPPQAQNQLAAMEQFRPQANMLNAADFQTQQQAQPQFGFGAGQNPFMRG